MPICALTIVLAIIVYDSNKEGAARSDADAKLVTDGLWAEVEEVSAAPGGHSVHRVPEELVHSIRVVPAGLHSSLPPGLPHQEPVQAAAVLDLAAVQHVNSPEERDAARARRRQEWQAHKAASAIGDSADGAGLDSEELL